MSVPQLNLRDIVNRAYEKSTIKETYNITYEEYFDCCAFYFGFIRNAGRITSVAYSFLMHGFIKFAPDKGSIYNYISKATRAYINGNMTKDELFEQYIILIKYTYFKYNKTGPKIWNKTVKLLEQKINLHLHQDQNTTQTKNYSALFLEVIEKLTIRNPKE